MSERPTPDTDAVLARLVKNRAGNSCDAVVIHHARKLERERDEAREQYDALATEHMLVVNKLCNERNEVREALASREVVIAQQNVITDLILECNTAREALMKIEQIFIDSDDTYEDLIKMGNIARAVLETAK